MILISISLIFNIITLYLDINSNTECIVPFIIIGATLGLYKSMNTNSWKDSFNMGSFKYTLNKQHIYELVSYFLLSLSIYNIDIYNGDFYILDIPCMILFALFMYRFLLFNLLSKESSKSY